MPEFVPRPWQPAMLAHIAEHPRCAVFAAMGSGKTIATLIATQGINLLDEGPGLIIAPKRVAQTTWPKEVRKWDGLEVTILAIKGDAAARARCLKRKADFYTINYEQLPWLVAHLGDAWPFRTIIADECFVAGTPIATPTGECAIEALKIGDLVETHVGVRAITRVYKRQAKPLKLVSVKLSNGVQLDVTENHPFFTDAGWLPARMCAGRRLYDAVGVSNLSSRLHSDEQQGSRADAQRQDTVLLPRVSHEGEFFVQPGHAGAVPPTHDQAACENGDLLELWAAMVRRASGEDVGEKEGCPYSASRRQRHGDGTNRSAGGSSAAEGFRVELDRAVGRSWSRLSLALQARLCRSAVEDMPRSGWSIPPHHAGKTAGHTEDREITVVGVERSPHHEQEGLVPVFDLEVEGASTFFAGGVLVHNSTKLKGFRLRQGGKRTKALSKVIWRDDIVRVILLTGTPAPNGIKDLWGQLWFLDKGKRLGKTWGDFVARWFRPSWDGYGIEPFAHSQAEIHRRIADICITVDPRDYMPIDEPIEVDIEVELPDAARAHYEEMEALMFTELDALTEVEAINAASRTNKCLQIANGFAYHGDRGDWTEIHDAKLDALESIREEAGGMPLLVGYQFKTDLIRIKRRFPDAKTLDEITVEEFATGKYPMLVGHPASMGHGVDGLQEGTNILVDFSSGWNLEFDQQILERIGPVRQMQSGLNRPVYRYRIIATGTVDEMVKERREGKASVQEILLEAMKRKQLT